MTAVMEVRNLFKTFTLHQQHGTELAVLADLSFTVQSGQCLILQGQSGAGKSTLLRTLYGNYLPSSGQLRIVHQGQWLDLAAAPPRDIVQVRRHTLGYVSQFLRVIPRVSCLDVVMEPALQRGMSVDHASEKARMLLARLSIPQRLWSLAPGTFSGGEQQRVNIARSFMVDWPVLLLDEPTASLDQSNRAVVIDLINQARAGGTAIVAISHDKATCDAIADCHLDMTSRELSYAA
jgi:alpha-D-ribose 1-methylphosphonate 5-triphosphate synthase subunit PhnL